MPLSHEDSDSEMKTFTTNQLQEAQAKHGIIAQTRKSKTRNRDTDVLTLSSDSGMWDWVDYSTPHYRGPIMFVPNDLLND